MLLKCRHWVHSRLLASRRWRQADISKGRTLLNLTGRCLWRMVSSHLLQLPQHPLPVHLAGLEPRSSMKTRTGFPCTSPRRLRASAPPALGPAHRHQSLLLWRRSHPDWVCRHESLSRLRPHHSSSQPNSPASISDSAAPSPLLAFQYAWLGASSCSAHMRDSTAYIVHRGRIGHT